MKLYNLKTFQKLYEDKFDKLFGVGSEPDIVKELAKILEDKGWGDGSYQEATRQGEPMWIIDNNLGVIIFCLPHRITKPEVPGKELPLGIYWCRKKEGNFQYNMFGDDPHSVIRWIDIFGDKIEPKSFEELVKSNSQIKLNEAKFDKVFDTNYPDELVEFLTKLDAAKILYTDPENTVDDSWHMKIGILDFFYEDNSWDNDQSGPKYEIYDYTTNATHKKICMFRTAEPTIQKIKSYLKLEEAKFDKVFGMELPDKLEELNYELLNLGYDFKFMKSNLTSSWWKGTLNNISIEYDTQDHNFIIYRSQNQQISKNLLPLSTSTTFQIQTIIDVVKEQMK